MLVYSEQMVEAEVEVEAVEGQVCNHVLLPKQNAIHVMEHKNFETKIPYH